MLSSWINHASDWNPQLVRELKGRFKARNVLMAIATSVLVQLGIIIFFYNQLPADHGFSIYCTSTPDILESSCLKDANGNFLVNWADWWADMMKVLHWFLMYGLIVPGVFTLVVDLYQEEQRGTLNFVRLSPQSAWTILIGKLLGVPSLVYVAIAVAVPFHIVAAVGAKLPLWVVLSFYGVVLGGSFLVYSAALLNGFLSKLSGGLGNVNVGSIYALTISGFTAIVFVPLYMLWNAYFTWNPFLHFFLTGENYDGNFSTYNPFIPHAFLLINLAISSYWIWQALHRCFHQPGATIISKRQSYGLVLYLEVLIVGFALLINSSQPFSDTFSTIGTIAVINIGMFLGLIALLSISRQSLMDWARYRHFDQKAIAPSTEHPPQQNGSRLRTRLQDLIWDLVWGERSPAIVAIALNLLIFSVPLLLLVAFGLDSWEQRIYGFAGVIITINLVILYAAILQLVLLMKTLKRVFWAAIALGTLIFVPIFAAILSTSSNPILAHVLFLFSPIPWVTLSRPEGFSMALISKAILGQWLAIVMVNVQLTQQLKQLGQSASQALFTGSER
ncbi:MAG: hypothetical protein SFY66_22800 [Oculatellaceae cyanobacterium bins.114]|nr:hypothetical protein [Oculatellaceae cyanobacterium bins.114]